MYPGPSAAIDAYCSVCNGVANVRGKNVGLSRCSTVHTVTHFWLLLHHQDAVKALNTLQTNAQVLEQIRRTRGRLAHNSLPEMIQFTERAGVTVSFQLATTCVILHSMCHKVTSLGNVRLILKEIQSIVRFSKPRKSKPYLSTLGWIRCSSSCGLHVFCL